MSKPKISIIIPCYNEESTISKIITKVLEIKLSKEIILVDDCSTDETRKIISNYEKKENFKIIYNKKNSGKGACIKAAQKLVSGEYVIIQDADLEYDPNDYYEIIKEFEKKGSDVIYGSRLLNLEKSKFSSNSRIYINRVLTFIFNLLYKQNITDAHTCYKSFKSELFKNIKLVENGFNFCAEINCKVANKKIKINEIAISYNGRTHAEGKKIKFSDGVETLATYLKYLFKV
jgi:dolichol-phosphate mannosyltransferase